MFDSSSYKCYKSGIKFISSYMPFTILVPKTYAFRTKRTTSLYFLYRGIRLLLCFETLSVFFSRIWFITGVGLFLNKVTLLFILLLNVFLYSLTSLLIPLLMWSSVTSFSWIKVGWHLFFVLIELNLLLLSLLVTLLPRVVLIVFQVLSMLSLVILFSLFISSFDVCICLRTWFSFFRSSIWFSYDYII